ncbi:glycine/sarcosine/betaine reductase component B subunit [Ohessyouella blattaphilus]|uniref:Glycine/sarcosine/betaine reductase component B subunit n=1 Tax=Ohessyouella blattaphilus TaxID=2949333 RepID=A0ABT1EKG1_9FIRM|nr:glycine/sarcosine/betaine reductase component B subunit [Ohessyouella blattaphilus]MCP1110161.1 glycine/sarcosine/betaine reductase component B subunit [Ohessyouella blattaphilus]MCR8563555.1 glycine/sarcosine/betaine reductase component B subunit [Ohessyouella blattaphilus]
MKLTVETVQIKDLQFGEKTRFEEGVLYINKQDILDFAKEEPCFETLKIDIARPGDSTRIINVVDVVEPRCKVSGNIDWPGVLSDDYEIAGSGVTRAAKGMGITLCQNNTYWSRKWGSYDMSGECAKINPYAKMPQLVIEPMAEEGADFRDYREGLRRVGYKTSVLIAKTTLGVAPESTETFDNETQYPDLPSIAYSYQIYSKQYDTQNYREPMVYGNAIPDSLPLIMRPTEVLDGAISLCGGFRCVTTYEIQNHPIIVELMRRHGKDINFAGVLITVTSVEAKHRYLVSKMAANLLKEELHADGVIVTKGVGGASTLCVGAIASEAEKLGIKAVPIIQILNGKSNLDVECLISEQNVDGIVCSGTYYHNFTLPPVETLLGGPEDALYLSGDDGVIGGHKIATGDPAKGQVRSTYMKQVGLMSQIGFSYGMAVDY